MASIGTYDHVAQAGQANLAVTGIAGSPTSYTVYDTDGTIVASGTMSGTTVTIPAPNAGTGWEAGWYLLLFTSTSWNTTYGYVADQLQVNVLRSGVANLAPVPAAGTTPAADDANNRGLDLYLHGFTAMGPTRWQIKDTVNPTTYTAGTEQGGNVAKIASNIALEQGAAGYLNPSYADAQRPRPQWVQFPNQFYTVTGYSAGVTSAVAALGPGTGSNVKYFEGLNEPEGQNGRTAAQSAAQYNAFRTAVKAGNSQALAAGPGEVSYSPDGAALGIPLSHFDTFLSTITAGTLDACSVHDYNAYNGDWLVTDGWLGGLRTKLAARGYPSNLPLFISEVGAAGMSDWGLFDPNRGIQWTSILLLTGEQWGIPKENLHWFYDSRLGGDPTASWLKDSTGDLRPYATLFRVYSEELFGTSYSAALNFGTIGNRFFRGNVMRGPSKTTVALLAQGQPTDTVKLAVSDSGPITYVDWRGKTATAAVTGGVVTIPVGSKPVYVRLSASCTVGVADAGNGLSGSPTNLALTATAYTGQPDTLNVNYINDDQWRTGGYLPAPVAGSDIVFMTSQTPDYVELRWGSPTTIGKVLLRQLPPWPNFPSGGADAMLDGKLEAYIGGSWVPVPTVARNHWNDRGVYSNPTRGSFLATIGAQSYRTTFFDQHWCHNIDLSVPVTTTRLRLTCNKSSVGNVTDATAIAGDKFNVLQTLHERLMVSQLAVFAPAGGAVGTSQYAPFRLS